MLDRKPVVDIEECSTDNPTLLPLVGRVGSPDHDDTFIFQGS